MSTVSKIARLIRRENDDDQFMADVGKIITNPDSGTAMFDMSYDEAQKLIDYCNDNDNVGGGASFNILKQMDIQRGRNFGQSFPQRRNGRNYQGGRGGGYRGNYQGRGGGGGYRGNNSNYQGRGDGGGYRGNNNNRGGGGYRGNNQGRSWDDNSNSDGRRRN